MKALDNFVSWWVGRLLAKGHINHWALKQVAATPGRYYGGDGTIHKTTHLDVELYHGQVVAVWFRCQMLPFMEHEVDEARAAQFVSDSPRSLPGITGVEVEG